MQRFRTVAWKYAAMNEYEIVEAGTITLLVLNLANEDTRRQYPAQTLNK
jgi:hypothetical protein